MSTQIAYLGLGSNLSEPLEQVKAALRSIANLPDTKLVATSSFYASKPLGPQDQPDFINAVCQIETALPPLALLKALQLIEREQGRIKKRHWGERLIDLDILLYANQKIQTPELTVPHSQMHLRDFVLIPLAEMAPNLEIPEYGAVEKLIEGLEDSFLIPLSS